MTMTEQVKSLISSGDTSGLIKAFLSHKDPSDKIDFLRAVHAADTEGYLLADLIDALD